MEFFDAFDNIGWIRIFIKLVQLENNDRPKVTVRLADSITGSPGSYSISLEILRII